MRVNFWLLFGWLSAFVLLACVVVLFVPLTGWGWTSAIEPLGCRPLGWCVEPELVPKLRVEEVSIRRLVACQSAGLDGCADLLSWHGARVRILIVDGRYVGNGILLSRGERGRELRYLALGADGPSDVAGVFYCSYAGKDEGDLSGLIADLPVGAPMFVTAELRWSDDSALFEPYDVRGDPSCWLVLVNGRLWDERSGR